MLIHPGDYATLNSYQLRDGTMGRSAIRLEISLNTYRTTTVPAGPATITGNDRERLADAGHPGVIASASSSASLGRLVGVATRDPFAALPLCRSPRTLL
jgi:hypothetical protein